MDKLLRNVLRNTVTACRRLLEAAVAETLEGQFGIHASGKVEDEARMGHLSGEDRVYREQVLTHLEHIRAGGLKPKEAVEQLRREAAFTHLNRLCAYKMMETRELIREAVSRGLKSQGFLFYLADHPDDEKLWSSGRQETAYRNFLEWLGNTFSPEIGVLFSLYDVANRLFPPQRVLDEVLELINNAELAGVWAEDETIGWVYQYFTPKELRDKARKANPAPQNSYELAFRNQFYTPRYVVQFLTDNTLGRTWYEMRRGDTALTQQCQYLVRCPNEIFLAEGEELPAAPVAGEELSQEELLRQPVYIAHRAKKDPREIRMLDPAGGSGHFGLYCFDLFETIYAEAYDDPDLGSALQTDYPNRTAFARAVPGLILAHNIHIIDIDPRAVQIAALALWLRAQRAYQALGLKAGERPEITKSNIVCAEPMPGEKDLLEEFSSSLHPPLVRQLVGIIFDKMALAGEAGSLLKIEEELGEAIAAAKSEWQAQPEPEQLGFWPKNERPLARQLSMFDTSGISDEQFFDRVEGLVLGALEDYARHAAGPRSLQRRLFADDAERGFAFIEVCRKRYDVVLMNPPFGAVSTPSKAYITDAYSNSGNNAYAAFIERWLERLQESGLLGAITSRAGFFLSSFEKWRNKIILDKSQIHSFVDIGPEVMDEAMVEAAAYCLSIAKTPEPSLFVRLLGQSSRVTLLISAIDSILSGTANPYVFIVNPSQQFPTLTGAPFVYWVHHSILSRLTELPSMEPSVAEVRVGLQTSDDPRFVRTLWEIPYSRFHTRYTWGARPLSENPLWVPHVKSGASQPWFSPITVAVNWGDNGADLRNFKDEKGKCKAVLRNVDYYFRPGFSWTRRAVRFLPYAVPRGCIPTVSRYMAYPASKREFESLGVTASNVAGAFLRFYGEEFERPNYLVENLKVLPWPQLPTNLIPELESVARQQLENRRRAYQNHEPFHEFTVPARCWRIADIGALAFDRHSLLGDELDRAIADAYEITATEQVEFVRDLREAVEVAARTDPDDLTDGGGIEDDARDFVLRTDPRSDTESVISYAVGCSLGRWDIRIATSFGLAPKLAGPFDPLPICPPGMLISPDCLPATPGRIVSEEWLRARPDAITLPPDGTVARDTIPDEEYPLRIDWDGILVDDLDHADDIVRRVRDVLEVLWGERAEAIEQEACEMLGFKDLREYFRKPAKGGFWIDHVQRYSKSRRKAPIYWLLQSSKKNYALWLYYHRLDKDLLFKALVNYVEPKIRLEETRLAELRRQQAAAGGTGRGARQAERQAEKQEALLSELHDFHDKLRRAADLGLEPDLNDGVVLNIAPLWELVPWDEPRKYWEELREGKYEWSGIGKQLREKGLVK